MALAGKRVLVIEDEFLVAAMLCDFIEDEGAVPVGPFGRVDEGLCAIAEGGFDAAVLDWNLAGDPGIPLAHALAGKGVPFVIATGYGQVEEPFGDRPLLAKPYSAADVIAALKRILG